MTCDTTPFSDVVLTLLDLMSSRTTSLRMSQRSTTTERLRPGLHLCRCWMTLALYDPFFAFGARSAVRICKDRGMPSRAEKGFTSNVLYQTRLQGERQSMDASRDGGLPARDERHSWKGTGNSEGAGRPPCIVMIYS